MFFIVGVGVAVSSLEFDLLEARNEVGWRLGWRLVMRWAGG